MKREIKPCALLNAAGTCTALKSKYQRCKNGKCPFYVTADERARSEAVAMQRCERLKIPYGDDYIRLIKGDK